MAEKVQYHLEAMLPELEDLQRQDLFSSAELRAIVRARTDFEYALQRRKVARKAFLDYIQYEVNLEALRRRRKTRAHKEAIAEAERLGMDPPVIERSLSDTSAPRRIHTIFRRAVRKHRSDRALWLHYIAYCRAARAHRRLGTVFAQALDVFPRDAELWVLAAAWEFERGNSQAARQVYQRGLRVNGKSSSLWLDYLHMELKYHQRLLDRRRVLGQTLDSDSDDDNDGGYGSDDGGDDSSELSAETRLVREMKRERVEKRRTASRARAALREAKLPRAVYRNAIAALPSDVELRMACLRLMRAYDETGMAIEDVYHSLERDLGDNPAVAALLCARPVDEFLALTTAEQTADGYENALVATVDAFEDVMGRLVMEVAAVRAELGSDDEDSEQSGSSDEGESGGDESNKARRAAAWEASQLAIGVCEGLGAVCLREAERCGQDLPGTAAALVERVAGILETMRSGGFCSPGTFGVWLACIRLYTAAGGGQEVQPLRVAELATEAFPDSPPLWTARLDLEVRADALSEETLRGALDCAEAAGAGDLRSTCQLVAASKDAWTSGGAQSNSPAFGSSMTVAEAVDLLTSAGSNRTDRVLSFLAIRLGDDDLVAVVDGALDVRRKPTEALFWAVLRHETALAEDGLRSQARVEALFQRAVDSFPASTDLWLAFVRFVGATDASRVSRLYWQATRALPDADAFVREFSTLEWDAGTGL